ncbi:MAG: hypothetical protein ACLGI8_09495 [Acidimicrobiia bacterium]
MHPFTDARPVDFAEAVDEFGERSVTVVQPAINWVDDEDQEWTGAWAVAMRFTHGVTGLELVDLRVFSVSDWIPIGVGIENMSTLQRSAELDDGSHLALFRTTKPWAGRQYFRGARRPPGGITMRLLRRLPLDELERVARQQLSGIRPQLPDLDREWPDDLGKRTGRRGVPHEVYARLAARYLELVDEGDPAPVKALAAETHQAYKTVLGQLGQARRLAILSKPPKGRAGGELLAYGRELLGA